MYDVLRFLDPTLKLVLTADGDPPAGGGGDGGGGGGAGGDGGGSPSPGAGDGNSGGDDNGGGRPSGEWTQEALVAQVNRQHRKIKDLETEAAAARELREENERLRQLAEAAARGSAPPADNQNRQQQQQSPQNRQQSPAPPAGDADTIRAQARFEVQLEQLQNNITEKYANDWPTVHANFERAGGVPPEMMHQILATDDPAFVMIHVGKDPVKMQQLLDMTGARRQAALIKIGMEKEKPPADVGGAGSGGGGAGAGGASPPKRPSGAPPPPGNLPPGGGGTPAEFGTNLYDERYDFDKYYRGPRDIGVEKAADEAWYAERMRQKRESSGRPWSVGGKAGVGGRQ